MLDDAEAQTRATVGTRATLADAHEAVEETQQVLVGHPATSIIIMNIIPIWLLNRPKVSLSARVIETGNALFSNEKKFFLVMTHIQ